MSEHKTTLYKAALLHDIGKFWQRTYNPETKKEEGGRWDSHPALSKKAAQSWLANEDLSFIVANHHEADLKNAEGTSIQKALASLVCEGDTLASGAEREKSDTPYRKFFQAILSKVNFDKTEDKEPAHVWKQRLANLTADKYEFPHKDKNPGDPMTEQYRDSWAELQKEAGHIPNIHPDSLLYLCKKYLWCIPSAFYFNVPDISLYEHSRLTAALALCLHDYVVEKNNGAIPADLDLTAVKKLRQEKTYLLLCGDVTGIQKYIYNIAHSGAMKALKGRSFWLQQIVDTIAFTLLERCGLYHANLLFSTGGKFCVLLPNTTKVKVELEDMIPALETEMALEYDGNINLVFGQLPISGYDVLTTINEKWAELFKITDAEKTRKYASSLKEPDFFEPGNLYGELELCQATKRELFPKSEIPKGARSRADADIGFQHYLKISTPYGNAFEELTEEDEKTGRFISEEQHNAIKVGHDIRNDKRAVIKSKNPCYSVLGWENVDFLTIKEAQKQKPDTERIFYLNDDNHLAQYQSPNIVQGWRFYGGDWKFDGEFEDILKKTFGIPRLGILRMDVDNLGRVFHKGLKRPAFSRIVQLSTMVDFFFSCYLNKLKNLWWSVDNGITEVQPLHEESTVQLEDMLTIIYAGGDDLFIVGAWNVLPDVAIWIQEQFTAFTCENPNLTISAGIALFENKFPLYKAAKEAGEALDKAKDQTGKNSICFLGVPMNWEDFKKIRQWAKNWHRWVKDGYASKGFLGRLGGVYLEYDEHNRAIKRLKKEFGEKWYELKVSVPRDPLWGRWRWQGCYHLNRHAQSIASKHAGIGKEVQDFAANFFVNRFGTHQNAIEILPVAVGWADLLLRTKFDKDDQTNN